MLNFPTLYFCCQILLIFWGFQPKADCGLWKRLIFSLDRDNFFPDRDKLFFTIETNAFTLQSWLSSQSQPPTEALTANYGTDESLLMMASQKNKVFLHQILLLKTEADKEFSIVLTSNFFAIILWGGCYLQIFLLPFSVY